MSYDDELLASQTKTVMEAENDSVIIFVIGRFAGPRRN